MKLNQNHLLRGMNFLGSAKKMGSLSPFVIITFLYLLLFTFVGFQGILHPELQRRANLTFFEKISEGLPAHSIYMFLSIQKMARKRVFTNTWMKL